MRTRRHMTTHLLASPAPISIPLLLREALHRHDSRVAIIDRERTLTYREVALISDHISDQLRGAGVRRGDRVGIYMHNNAEAIVSLVAILNSGAAYVPIDPRQPDRQSLAILRFAQPKVLLVSRTSSFLSARCPTTMVTLAVGNEKDGRLTCVADDVRTHDLFYILFTSGSTGQPKGVAQRHEGLAHLLRWHLRASGIDHSNRVLQFAPLGFDVHFQEIFPTLVAGGTICVADQRDRVDPASLMDTMCSYRIATAFLPVSVLARLVSDRVRCQALPRGLCHIVTAGEQLYIGSDLAGILRDRPHLCLHNHYGPTETHVVTAATFCGKDELQTRAPIGKPIGHVSITVRDVNGRVLPDGEAGELWIAGPCLAAGYLDDETRTSEKFCTCDGIRWYRTGDLGCRRTDGTFEFHGRTDNQVKIRGHRVEIDEVERSLRSLSYISECAVHTFVDSQGELTLAAWYVSNEDVPIGALRRDLTHMLPQGAVPSTFIRVNALPLGPTGKIDRRALVLSGHRPELGVRFEPPRSQVESFLADILKSLLQIEMIGRNDNFFDVGATSSTLAHAADEISRQHGIRFSTLMLLEYPTIASLAEVLTTSHALANTGALR